MKTRFSFLILPCLVLPISSCKKKSAVGNSHVADTPQTGANIGLECNKVSQSVKDQIMNYWDVMPNNEVSMMGCPEGWPDDPKSCLSDFPPSNYGEGLPGLVVKTLRTLKDRPKSGFGMATSPDGRFSSMGNGIIEDLARDGRGINVSPWDSYTSPHEIELSREQMGQLDEFKYFAAFSPDNRSYMFPGMVCRLGALFRSKLRTVGRDSPESECQFRFMGVASEGLLAGIGSAYVTMAGHGADASVEFEVFNSTHLRWNRGRFKMPDETDAVISPLGRILVSRWLKNGADDGHAFRVRVVEPDDTREWFRLSDPAGLICLRGERPSISFDNRFIAFHHRADGSPQDSGTTGQQSNIFIYDLKAERSIRITNMPKGTGAFAPHFRADGWLMFRISTEHGQEAIMASNAALLLMKASK